MGKDADTFIGGFGVGSAFVIVVSTIFQIPLPVPLASLMVLLILFISLWCLVPYYFEWRRSKHPTTKTEIKEEKQPSQEGE